MNMTTSIFNSTNNYSYLMGSSDQDLLDNQTHHILRNIDNNIMDYRSNNIKQLDENLNKIKENILLFLKDDDNDELYKNIQKEIEKYEKENKNNIKLKSFEKKSEPEPEPEPKDKSKKGSKEELESGKVNEILLKSYDLFLKEYSKVQDEFLDIENKMKNNINKTKKDIKLLNSAIEYTKILNNDYTLENGDELIEQIRDIGNTINKNNKIYLIKKEYVKKRKKLNEYLNIIKTINLNINNTCTICLTRNVNKYFNPCGHTCCSECIERMLEYEGNNGNISCTLCRVNILDIRDIYFN